MKKTKLTQPKIKNKYTGSLNSILKTFDNKVSLTSCTPQLIIKLKLGISLPLIELIHFDC